MTTNVRLYFVGTLLVMLVTAPACYTLVRHPRLADNDYSRPESTNCESCHSDGQIWSYHQPSNAPYYFDRFSRGWGLYYDVPWWYENYWNYENSDLETVPMHREYLPALGDQSNPLPAPPPATGGVSGGGRVNKSVRDATPNKSRTDGDKKKRQDNKPRKKSDKKKGDGGEQNNP